MLLGHANVRAAAELVGHERAASRAGDSQDGNDGVGGRVAQPDLLEGRLGVRETTSGHAAVMCERVIDVGGRERSIDGSSCLLSHSEQFQANRESPPVNGRVQRRPEDGAEELFQRQSFHLYRGIPRRSCRTFLSCSSRTNEHLPRDSSEGGAGQGVHGCDDTGLGRLCQ